MFVTCQSRVLDDVAELLYIWFPDKTGLLALLPDKTLCPKSPKPCIVKWLDRLSRYSRVLYGFRITRRHIHPHRLSTGLLTTVGVTPSWPLRTCGPEVPVRCGYRILGRLRLGATLREMENPPRAVTRLSLDRSCVPIGRSLPSGSSRESHGMPSGNCANYNVPSPKNARVFFAVDRRMTICSAGLRGRESRILSAVKVPS
jgi:hypothetical protein